MNVDRIEKFGGSLVQHGAFNDRVYLMRLGHKDFPQILNYLNYLAVFNGYSKIFAKVTGYAKDCFERKGYRVEASIPRFYNAKEEVFFMTNFYQSDHLIDDAADQVHQVLEVARKKADESSGCKMPDGCECRLATTNDSEAMANLYAELFASDPFLIQDPNNLAEVMSENLVYAGIWNKDHLLALASAEVDCKGKNAEMKAFAIHPDWMGHGLANVLLHRLEEEMRSVEITTCFTLARAKSYGMNICFARSGYRFSGTLIKNTQISGGLESMNVWYKHV